MANGPFFPATEWAWAQDVGNSGAKYVLIACARYARDKWWCIASQPTLAAATEQGERTVRRNLDYLEAHKFIERKHRFDEQGNRTSDLITLAPAANLAGSDAPPANLAGSDQRPNRPVVKLAATSDQQELTTGQIGHRSDWPGKSFPTGKTKDNNKNKGGVGGSKPQSKPDEHPRFAEFYAAYPLHKAPGAARKAFNNAVKNGADPQELIDAAKRYCDDRDVRRGFAKHPSTWLNQECWADEVTPLADTGTDGVAGHGPRASVNQTDWSNGGPRV